MNFWFSGQYSQEQAAGAITAKEALTLDTDVWPITVELSFLEDPDPNQPDEFAVTNQITTTHYELKFRNDAPHFQNGPAAAHYDIKRFYQETVAHELGHVFSFALNSTGTGLLSKLFGVPDTTEAWFPSAKGWGDRAGEAIAETFKDAFLPAEYREYDNRTNIHLHYSYMDFFRAIFRNAITEDMLRDTENKMGVPPGTLGSVPFDPPIGIGEQADALYDTFDGDELDPAWNGSAPLDGAGNLEVYGDIWQGDSYGDGTYFSSFFMGDRLVINQAVWPWMALRTKGVEDEETPGTLKTYLEAGIYTQMSGDQYLTIRTVENFDETWSVVTDDFAGAGGERYILFTVDGNELRVDLYDEDPELGGTVLETLSATLTGDLVTKFGAGVVGGAGLYFRSPVMFT